MPSVNPVIGVAVTALVWIGAFALALAVVELTACAINTAKTKRGARRGTPCTCGHTPAAHEHFRPGTDCGICPPRQCPAYRP